MTVQSGSIVNLLQENGLYSGELNVQVIFRQNDSIVNFGKYMVNTPEIKDTVANSVNFIDVQRYSLPNGVYDMELTLDDPNNPTDLYGPLPVDPLLDLMA